MSDSVNTTTEQPENKQSENKQPGNKQPKNKQTENKQTENKQVRNKPVKNKASAETHLKWYGLPALYRFVRPHIRLILCIVIFMGLSSAADAILPLFQDYAISHFVGGSTLDTMPVFILLYSAILLFQAASGAFGCFAAAKAEVLVDQDIRQACFDHVQTLSFSYFNQNSVGYIHSRMISDPNRIGIVLSWVLMDFIADIVYIVGIFIVMFLLNPWLGLLLAAVVPVEIGLTAFFQKHLAELNRLVREINGKITGNFNEGITGARTIKSLVIEDKMEQDFYKDTSEMRITSIRAARYRALFHSSIVFVSSIVLALVLWKGGLLTQRGLLLVGTLSVFMNYATSIATYVRELVGTISMLVSTQANIERVTNLLATDSDVKDSPEVIQKYGDAFEPKKENWEELHGDVEFKDVTFCYPDGQENVLEHFNLKVPQGSMTAIVGETGAGKSTLVNLVCRFFEPTSGQVLIDGRDARERSQLWLHSHIGYVLQTPHLFSGTIRENLLYGNPDATQEEIDRAVKAVSADRIISRMEKGLDSEVGEGGDLLSTGEKQLISFARALLANPQILVLDEATSSVDTLTEQAIQRAIKTVTTGRTSFIIAHRLSTIREADMILVMKDGKIIERGNHRALMAAKGYYYRLYTQQFIDEGTLAALR